MAIAQRTARERVNAIGSSADLAAFIRDLREDLVRNPEAWENRALEDYMEAMAAWVEDMPGYYQNLGQDVPEHPTWRSLADILMGAKTYS